MTDYSSAIAQIQQATTLQELSNIAAEFPATATGPGGVLYSGQLANGVDARKVALAYAKQNGLNILDNTRRGQFLADQSVKDAISLSAKNIFERGGSSVTDAKASAYDFLYGNINAAEGSATSLWGRASATFIGSLG